MNIRKIILSEDGFKGAEVHFFQEKEKSGRPMMVLTKEYPKNPIHFGLEKMFKDLRLPLLEICGYVSDDMDKNVVAQLLMETSVSGIEMDSEYIVLSGEKAVFDGKYIKLKTCKLQESDNYVNWEIVKELAKGIEAETKEYLNGTKKVDDLEVAIRFLEAGKSKDFTLEDFNNLPLEQRKEWAIKLIEHDLGGVAMLAPDYTSVPQEDLENVVPLDMEVPVPMENQDNGEAF